MGTPGLSHDAFQRRPGLPARRVPHNPFCPPIPDMSTPRPAAASVYRRAARRLIPFLFVLYLVAFLDRVNVGFAKLQMAGDLGLSESDYGVGAGIFFLGYFLLEIPSNLLLHRIGARLAIARIVLLWGVISMAMALVQGKASFYGLRFLLGAAEAGFFPGIILYLTFWFPTRQRARSTALFMTALAVSGVIGGPMSGGILEHLDGWLDLRGWQWLFLLEGAPAVMLGLVCLGFLDDGPDQAGWLSGAEQSAIRRDLAADLHAQRQDRHQRFRESLKDGRVWSFGLINLSLATSIYAVSFWLPQIVHDLDQGGFALTGWLSAIPYLFATVAMLGLSHSSDRHQERRWHIVFGSVLGSLGLVLCALFLQSPWAALLGLSLATAGIYSAVAIFWSLPTALLSGSAAAGGIALINSIAALGGYLGPVMMGWIRESTGSVEFGLIAIAIGLLLSSGIVLRVSRR